MDSSIGETNGDARMRAIQTRNVCSDAEDVAGLDFTFNVGYILLRNIVKRLLSVYIALNFEHRSIFGRIGRELFVIRPVRGHKIDRAVIIYCIGAAHVAGNYSK